MGVFRRGEKVKVLLFDNGTVTEGKMIRDGNVLIDGLLGRQYPIVTRPLIFRKGRNEDVVYLVDVEKGCTVELEKDEDLIKLKTNPDLIGKVIDSRLIQQAFAIKPETRQILAALVAGLLIGGFLGAIFL